MQEDNDENMRDDIRAQKRTKIGLTPNRPTAKTAVQRPPDGTNPPGKSQPRWRSWLLTWLLALLLVATILLIAARVLGSPTAWAEVRNNIGAWFGIEQLILSGDGAKGTTDGGTVDGGTSVSEQSLGTPIAGFIEPRLVLSDDFSDARSRLPLADEERIDQWLMGFVQNENVYRIRPWPGNVAWTVLTSVGNRPYRLETKVQINGIDQNVPRGYAGLLARYQDDANMYLFAVDGESRMQVWLQQNGDWQTLVSWTPMPVLNVAGSANILALEDDGKTIRFFANESLLYQLDAPTFPPGATGLVGGAQDVDLLDVDFDWLRVYELPEN